MHFPHFLTRCLPLLGAATFASSLLVLPASAQSAARPRIMGRVAAEDIVPAMLTLPLRDAAGLDALLTHQYTPGDPAFHHFLTPAEFTAKFGPTQADYDAAASWAKSQGLTVTATHPNRLLLEVSGPAAATEAAFKVRLQQVQIPEAGGRLARLARQPDTVPRVPAALAGRVSGVVGLDTMPLRRPHLRPANLTAAAGTGVGGGLSVSDIRAAYGFNSFSGTGSGQTIAIFQLATFAQSDIAAYQRANGLPQVPVRVITVGSGVAPLEDTSDNRAESTLDAEMALALTPNLSSVQVYECPNTSDGVLAGYNRIASDNTAAQVSTSWGLPETQTAPSLLNSEYAIFKQMAAQGQAVLSASGDLGAYDTGSTADGLTVDDPSSQPYVTGVGGTSLQTTSPGGSYLSETTWYNSPTSAAGGGVSTKWGVPDYQQSVPAIPNGRTVPDISLNSDPNTGYSIYFGGSWYVYGGTSAAAPLWAGLTALVNSRRTALGLGRVGFLNTPIYQIARNNAPANFHDIADGSSNGYYTAAAGYDPATGWGTPTVTLLNSLATYGQPAAPTPTPAPAPTPTPAPTPAPTITAHIAWMNADGRVALWSVDSAGSFTINDYGPYAGWSVKAAADDKAGKTRLLWTNTNGQMALWSVTTATGAFTHAEYGPYAGWTATALAVGADGGTRVLWNRTDNQAALWNVAASGNFTHSEYGPYAGYKSVSLGVGTDNHSRILWNRTDNEVSLWNLDTVGNLTFSDYGPYSGWTAGAVAVGTDNHPHLLWNRTDGQVALWNIDTANNFTHAEYGPYANYTAVSLAVGSDNRARILWNRTDGQAALWYVDASGNFTHMEYGPYAGWTAKSVAAP